MHSWRGYLQAHRVRREFFASLWCDGDGSLGMRRRAPRICGPDESEALFNRVIAGRCECVGCGAVPGANADGDGTHEPRRRARDADSSRAHSVITTRGSSPSTVATWGRTFRVQWTTCTRSSHCSIASATNATLTVIVFTLDETSYSRGARSARGSLSGLAARPRVVVPRQPGGG